MRLDLARRMDSSGPVRIGLAGAGQMGTDIVVQVGLALVLFLVGVVVDRAGIEKLVPGLARLRRRVLRR